jgi:ethanolamine utilization protein EutA (predicted chaperonin)
MHDLEFNHLHVDPGDEINEVAWSTDNVELTTVGIDIGSSTSHLMFARVHLQRLTTALSSRFVVVSRKVLWQSPILLTPYLPDYTIDVDELSGFVGGCYAYAGIEPGDIDSGAVILTGEAIKRHNARAIADLFSQEAGKFVCASAGHHMECQLAAHGSGAVALSRGHAARLLNVDIGGGTTKLALIENGRLVASAAIAVGGRLLVEDPKAGLTRIEEPLQEIARGLGITLALGQPLAEPDRKRVVARMVRLIMRMIDRRPADELMGRLLVTAPWPAAVADLGFDALTFSGGVAEYLYKREKRQFGDLGFDLAHALSHMLAHRRDLPPVWDPGQGIRATVIGAAQFSVQISGNTIAITRPDELPLQNLPVLALDFDLGDEIDADAVTAQCRSALAQADVAEGTAPVAFAFPWRGDPAHARLYALAAGICAAVPGTIAGGPPLVLLVDGDIGMSLGRIIRNEIAASANVIAIDGVQLKQFDYVDIGQIIDVTNVVPVIIKSLLFK